MNVWNGDAGRGTSQVKKSHQEAIAISWQSESIPAHDLFK